jgi:hypothetical protein
VGGGGGNKLAMAQDPVPVPRSMMRCGQSPMGAKCSLPLFCGGKVSTGHPMHDTRGSPRHLERRHMLQLVAGLLSVVVGDRIRPVSELVILRGRRWSGDAALRHGGRGWHRLTLRPFSKAWRRMVDVTLPNVLTDARSMSDGANSPSSMSSGSPTSMRPLEPDVWPVRKEAPSDIMPARGLAARPVDGRGGD